MTMPATGLHRRHQATAARLLLALYAEDKLDSPESWTWDAVARLPGWCLYSAEDRLNLQRICGALLLSPETRFWVQKPLLLGLQQLLGAAVFSRVTDYADQMQLPREPLSVFLEQAEFQLTEAGLPDLESLLIRSGATVLAATVDESLPRDMLVSSLGPGIGEINSAAANAIVEVATVLAQDGSTPTGNPEAV